MEDKLKKAILQAARGEPFRELLGIEIRSLEDGKSVVEMIYRPQMMNNIYKRAHGGALFALVDEAFETAAQTDGDIAVALNISVTYVASPEAGKLLRATAERVARTRRTVTYDIRVDEEGGRLICICKALAYRTGKPVVFPDQDKLKPG